MTDAPLMSLAFTLPWPPSANTYWRHIILGGKHKKARAHTLISEGGREYRVRVLEAIRAQKVPVNALKGRLAIHVIAYPPDRRRRDLSNLWKGMLDAIVLAGVIADDGDTDRESIERGLVRPQGLIELRISEIAHEPQSIELDLRAAAAHLVAKQREGLDDAILAMCPPF